MPDTTATALAAMVFDDFVGPEIAAPTRRLLTASVRRAVENAIPGLRLADWAADPGPDGEQFFCTVDLMRAELDADPLLASRCDAAVRADDWAQHSLRTLAAHLEAGGYDGAARSCRQALQVLVPTVGRFSLTAVIDQPRPA